MVDYVCFGLLLLLFDSWIFLLSRVKTHIRYKFINQKHEHHKNACHLEISSLMSQKFGINIKLGYGNQNSFGHGMMDLHANVREHNMGRNEHQISIFESHNSTKTQENECHQTVKF